MGTIALYVVLLLFGLKDYIPAIISTSPKAETMSPEIALHLLNKKRDCGEITEEDYQAQRAEIIAKL